MVHVEVEDLLLREKVLHPRGEDRLLDLSDDALLAREEEGARHLLRERAPSLTRVGRLQVREEGPHDTDVVQPVVLEETLILRRHEGVHHHARHLLDGDVPASLLVELPDHVPVVGVDGCNERDGPRVVLERGDIGKVVGEVVVQAPGEQTCHGGEGQTQAQEHLHRRGEPVRLARTAALVRATLGWCLSGGH